MTLDAALTLAILGPTILLLITEWVPPGVTGLCAIVALILAGVLPAHEALAGLTNPAVITVASMYVISAAVVRTGAAATVVNRLTRPGRVSPQRAFLLVLLATMLLSGFVNNTPLILILLPLVIGLAGRMNEAPSRLLIPLSFVSILGGSATLIGTSTNLIVASSLREVSGGAFELGMFDFTRLGVVLALVGGVLVIALRRRLLPERPTLGLLTRQGVAVEYVTEVSVRDNDGLAGRNLGDVQSDATLGAGLRILQVVRSEVVRSPNPELRLAAGDLLLVKGSPEAVLELRMEEGRRAAAGNRSESVRGVGLTLFELVVTPGSSWVGRTIGGLHLHDAFDVSVFAVQRHGAHMREKLERLTLLPGDVLLLQGSQESLRRLRDVSGVLVVESVDSIALHSHRAPLVGVALCAFVALSVTGLLAIEVAALCAALFAVLTGCVSVRRAYEAIGWDMLFVIAGTLALGAACLRTGLAEVAAHGVVQLAAPYGQRAVLGVVLVFTAALTQFLSNNATAAVMTPIAFELGPALEVSDPLPFIMAVAFGANCSFLTPVAYNTNLIVYGPGGYRFGDFLRLGLPLAIVYLGIAIALLPVLY
jgi:di/tricarboxylate transporter